MTTKTDIILQPCPFCGCAMSLSAVARDWWRVTGDHSDDCILLDQRADAPQTDDQKQLLIGAWNRRAAVKADRADHLRGVTNAGIMEIWRPYRHFPPDWICGFAHALLSRYSSDRLAEVRCNHCGWHGADADLVRDVAADEPEDGAADVCPRCKRIGDLQDIGQPAASAEPNTHTDDDAVDRFAAAMKDKLAQARAKGRHGWQECSPADLSAMLRAHVEKGDPRDVANFCCFLWSLGKPISTAPVAQEPVAEVLSSRKGNDTSTIDKALPAGTKIYVVASDCSRATQDDESLADTQRAIIEAAERRGYARAEAENVGYRTDAGRYREFFEAGLPITFLGIDYHDKPSLDAAIDAARAAKGADHG